MAVIDDKLKLLSKFEALTHQQRFKSVFLSPKCTHVCLDQRSYICVVMAMFKIWRCIDTHGTSKTTVSPNQQVSTISSDANIRNQAPPVPCSRANRCQHANNGGNNTADTEATTRAWITLQLDLLSAPPQRSETILIIAERENNPPPFYTPPPTYQDAWFDS
ncbi:uncharacterized protein LOC116925733 [Daphnia magna]|uniref:uncharacterized protein LOC116925733 n=1 Tax=Daphnia magna TaxID=35525 RepID=UPI001E1BB408|nr:uncharacterized protein LOC116925733 [Daphnia magna]